MDSEDIFIKQKKLYKELIEIREELSKKGVSIVSKTKLQDDLFNKQHELKVIELKIVHNSLNSKNVKSKLGEINNELKIPKHNLSDRKINDILNAVRQVVADGNLAKLHKELENLRLDILRDYGDYSDEIITQQAKISSILKNKRLQIMPTSEMQLEENKIFYYTLSLLTEIESRI
jgi:hypothetical protein